MWWALGLPILKVGLGFYSVGFGKTKHNKLQKRPQAFTPQIIPTKRTRIVDKALNLNTDNLTIEHQDNSILMIEDSFSGKEDLKDNIVERKVIQPNVENNHVEVEHLISCDGCEFELYIQVLLALAVTL